MGTEIDLIVGLGNPGAEYAATRHNAGFWFVDLLAREHGAGFTTARKLKGEAAEITVAGRRVRLLKPTTYMNLSGESVGATMRFYKVPAERVLVAYDELDLPLGRMQLKFDGGDAGHNGVASVIEHVGRKFWRLRFGVGHPRDREQGGAHKPVVDHVLGRASDTEESTLLDAIAAAVNAMPMLIEQGAERVKNRLHSRKAPASEKTKEAE
jgi:peptidyl-tRNA hydrolase, PTH1 family